MFTPKYFAEFLTHLSANELYEYQKVVMNETYNRLVFKETIPVVSDSETPLIRKKMCYSNKSQSPVKTVLCDDSDSDSEDTTPFSQLSWTNSTLSEDTTIILKKLSYFRPKEYSIRTFENQLEILDNVLSNTVGSIGKAKVTKNIFKIINKNGWYLDTNIKPGREILDLEGKFNNRRSDNSFDYTKLQNLIKNMNNPESFSKLHWDIDNIPDRSTFLSELKGFRPVKCNKEEVVKGVQFFLYIIDLTNGTGNKLRIVRHLFNFLAANEWFIEVNERFHNTIVRKLDEFSYEIHPEAVELVNDFSYFRDLTDKYTLGTNGDSLPYPTVSKEQLDREIDQYMAIDRAKINVKSSYLGDTESSS